MTISDYGAGDQFENYYGDEYGGGYSRVPANRRAHGGYQQDSGAGP